ncbi:MAG: hypothetical protein GY754_12395, partial [bacterium]|nr:hypothetical protein [bacterium]
PVVGLVLGIIAMKKQAGPREQIIASNFQIPGRAFIIVAKACGISAIATSIFFLAYLSLWMTVCFGMILSRPYH